jgi:ribose 1,5-bisphosphokinase PhnN
VVESARRRYGFVTVVEITAPEPVLQSRLTSRQRGSDGDIAQRLERSVQVAQLFSPDIVIRNVGRPDGGIRRLIRAIRTSTRIARRRRDVLKLPAEA